MRPKYSVQEAFTRFGASYEASFGDRMLPWHRKALHAIGACRTPALGGHVVKCTSCSVEDFAYHSCRHRSCPRCLKHESSAWLAARQAELLPVPYFHVVFSIPTELHSIIRGHQETVYPLLMEAAAVTLMRVAGSRERLNGTIGVMATLHTWSKTLAYHPHVHCLVPSGSVDSAGRWQSFSGPRLAPEGELSKAFCSQLWARLKKALPDVQLPSLGPENLPQVYSEIPQHGVEAVLRYLGRPLHRGPLSDYAIEAINGSEVSLAWRCGGEGKRRTMTVSGHEFLRRFLQHVWPDRTHKVRYFGLWSRKSRAQLLSIKRELEPAAITSLPVDAGPDPVPVALKPEGWLRCPHCPDGHRVRVSRFGPPKVWRSASMVSSAPSQSNAASP